MADSEFSLPQRGDFEQIAHIKYGPLEGCGWRPRMRARWRYRTPDDTYEAFLLRMVGQETRWLDIGCGRSLFPSNPRLARILADRCKLLVGVDPDGNIQENPYVHRAVQADIVGFEADDVFDVVSLRMVAEHIRDPAGLVRSLAAVTETGSRVLIYTVNWYSPITLLSALIPYRLHHPLKRLFWKTDPKDTFPTAYRMNTRDRLARQLREGGFDEVHFSYLDDCSTLSRLPATYALELYLRQMLRSLGFPHIETRLLGIYERRS